MSAIAPITVFDGAATPVSHTLTAISVSRTLENEIVAAWREKVATLPDYAQVNATIRTKTLKSGVVRVEVRLVVPVMEAILNQNAAGYTAAPKVAFEDTLVVIGFFSPRSTINSRRLARQMMANLLGNISTSVLPVATGPVPELIDQLVLPT